MVSVSNLLAEEQREGLGDSVLSCLDDCRHRKMWGSPETHTVVGWKEKAAVHVIPLTRSLTLRTHVISQSSIQEYKAATPVWKSSKT